jgi:hypothetical protein
MPESAVDPVLGIDSAPRTSAQLFQAVRYP